MEHSYLDEFQFTSVNYYPPLFIFTGSGLSHLVTAFGYFTINGNLPLKKISGVASQARLAYPPSLGP